MLPEKLKKTELEQIETLLKKEGFHQISFLPYFEISENFKKSYLKYLSEKKEANLAYLRNTEARFEIRNIHPQTQTIVAASFFYLNQKTLDTIKKTKYKIARYAWGRDYHNVLKKRMKKVCEKFSAGRAVVDSTPLPEKYLARKAGLGFVGRNGLLIHPQFGSFFLLAFFLMDKALPDDFRLKFQIEEKNTSEDIENLCKDCLKCVKACPSSAVEGGGFIHTSRCISYRTIEERENLEEIKMKKHKYIFGCDICQTVCPYNKIPLINEDKDFFPAEKTISIAEGKTEHLTDEDLYGSSLKRRTLAGLKKNIKLIGW